MSQGPNDKMAVRSRFIDIGANLTDPVFTGIYRGSAKHPNDFAQVLERAWDCGMEKIIITAGTLDEAKRAIEICRTSPRLFTTVGVHPTRCNELEAGGESYLTDLLELISANRDKIVAVGECGLDWDRLQFCSKEIQLKWFERQFFLAESSGLPMFLHMRNCADEFLDIIRRNRSKFVSGVVHSFDGSAESMLALTSLGLYIGLNGCSLRSAENLETVKKIPRDRILLETDAPWCDIRPTHPGFGLVKTVLPSKKAEKFVLGECVKGRNEPAHIVQVCEVVAATIGITDGELAAEVLSNTEQLFFASHQS